VVGMADFKRLLLPLGIFFLFSGADSAVAVADSSSVLFLLLLFGIWTKGVAVVSSTRLDRSDLFCAGPSPEC